MTDKFKTNDKNMFAKKGESVADDEIIRNVRVNPDANNIDEAAFKAMHNQNLQGYVQQGYSEKDARRMANERMIIARGALPK